jgi:hypothetical protein
VGPVGAEGPSRAPPSELPPEPARRPVVETELGGLFYLLNLALALELYCDFSTPARPGIELDPWHFVALLGRRLLDEPAAGDPAWRLLDTLRAPARFAPPRNWRIPRAWLAPFPRAGTWRYSRAGGRLRVRHPAGFLVLDSPLGRARLPRGVELRRSALPREPATPLDRWVARVAEYAAARLRLAGVEPVVLMRHRARVHVSPAHVDVVLSLATLPLEIRLAGLDRTPGFVPAARRHLAFHFE